jgi:hypothetical protein
VPSSVLVESRLEYSFADACRGLPASNLPLGKASLPVFRELAPAGTTVAHLGSDMGIQKVRVNVGIYNAGAATATASIEVHRPGCSKEPIATRTLAIPANSLIQISVNDLPAPCIALIEPLSTWWPMFTTVTVDQPSLSYATALVNDQPPGATFAVTAP